MKNVAVVLAAGSSSRFGSAIPKQFVELDGKMVVEHSVDLFDSLPCIDEVAIVVAPDCRGKVEQLAARRAWPKVKKIIDGGSERYLSSLNALMSFVDYPDDTNLLFHDAARPWVSESIVGRVVEALEKSEAVGVAIPSTDTVWECSFALTPTGRKIGRIPERSLMWRAQTPQAFRLPVIRDAYQRALQDVKFHVTDDCGVVRRYMPQIEICIVEGDERNRKITFCDDL